MEIAESRLEDESSRRTLHLAGPPEFIAERVLPALTEPAGEDGRGFALRAAFGTTEEVLEGLAAGHHDLAISTTRPRGACSPRPRSATRSTYWSPLPAGPST